MSRNRVGWTLSIALAGCGATGPGVGSAWGQASAPTLFVANNGNLEGSVSTFTIDPNGDLTFVAKIITGSRPSSQDFHPGTNAATISLTPDGRYIATGHTTSSNTFEQVTILSVNADSTLSPLGTFLTPNSPLDLQWIRDDTLAVVKTDSPSDVRVYRFNPAVPSLTLIDFEATGSFSTWLSIHPNGQFLFAQDSTGRTITSLRINMDGTLTLVETQSTGAEFPLGTGVSPDGTKIYAGGGISSGGNKVVGCFVDPVTGMLDAMPTGPFISPGASPKQVAVSGDNQYALVAHGTDATIRVMSIDPKSGQLTATLHAFDIGFQGSLGQLLTFGNVLFVTDRDTIDDGVRGVRSFTVKPDGALEQNGTIMDTTGITPDAMAVWAPPAPACPWDLSGDGVVGSDDLALMLGAWGSSGPGDFDGNGAVGSEDYALLLGAWGPCP